MMTKYDASVIQLLADKLYSKADRVIGFNAIVGVVLGALAGGGFGAAQLGGSTAATVLALVGAVLFGLVGAFIGYGRSFDLRFRAQQALCQMHIESNTRRD